MQKIVVPSTRENQGFFGFAFGTAENISARFFIPLVETFLSISTPRLPFASSFRFFAAAAAAPNPFPVISSPSADDEARPGRYVVERTEDVVVLSSILVKFGKLLRTTISECSCQEGRGAHL